MKRLAPKRSMSRRDARYMAAVSGVFAMIGTSRDAAALDDTAPTLPALVASSAQPGLLAGNFSAWVDIPDIEVPPGDERVNYGSASSDVVNERPSPPEQDAGCSVAVARSNVSPSTDSSSRTLALLCFLVALGLARRALFVERPRCAKSDVRSRPR